MPVNCFLDLFHLYDKLFFSSKKNVLLLLADIELFLIVLLELFNDISKLWLTGALSGHISCHCSVIAAGNTLLE